MPDAVHSLPQPPINIGQRISFFTSVLSQLRKECCNHHIDLFLAQEMHTALFLSLLGTDLSRGTESVTALFLVDTRAAAVAEFANFPAAHGSISVSDLGQAYH